jgi:hypothetical protein
MTRRGYVMGWLEEPMNRRGPEDEKCVGVNLESVAMNVDSILRPKPRALLPKPGQDAVAWKATDLHLQARSADM